MGLWPALRASRADLNSILQGGPSETAGKGRHRLRSVLVVAQVAGSLLLLIIAGLFVRSLRHAETMYLGFDPDHVLNVSVNPQGIGYDEARSNEFYRQLEARARALPGVQSVSLAYGVPMGNTNIVNAGGVTFEGQQLSTGQPPPSLFFNNIDPGYFATMRVPLIRGREFSAFDNESAPQVAIVNQTMADRFYPHQDPIGKRFSLKDRRGPGEKLADRGYRRERKVRVHRGGTHAVLLCSAGAKLHFDAGVTGAIVSSAGNVAHPGTKHRPQTRSRSSHHGRQNDETDHGRAERFVGFSHRRDGGR